jgi:Cu/Ag efflux pump CusA
MRDPDVTRALIIFLNVPFAGVGFIALFGVAVLNGLVLPTVCSLVRKSLVLQRQRETT